MSTLGEIKDAVMALPPEEQQVLLDLLSSRLRQTAPVETGRTLNPQKHPPLKGLGCLLESPAMKINDAQFREAMDADYWDQ